MIASEMLIARPSQKMATKNNVFFYHLKVTTVICEEALELAVRGGNDRPYLL